MDSAKCQVCGSLVEAGTKATVCPACETPTHPECWEYNGGCAIYACRESPAIKASKNKAAVVYIDGRATASRPERRGPGHPPPPPTIGGLVTGVAEFAARALGMVVGLFLLFAFLAGFIEGLTSNNHNRSRYTVQRSRSGPTRTQLLGFGDRPVQLRELEAMQRDHRASLDEIRSTGSLAIWSADDVVRLAATKTLVELQGNERTRQEYLCDLMGSHDHAQRKLARESIAKLGTPSKHALSTLIGILNNQTENADECMDLIEALQVPKALMREAAEGHHPPRLYEARVRALL